MIPNVFINQASEVLGLGLTGSKIASLCSSYAFDFGVDIPFPTSPFPNDGTVPNKRFALRKNLEAFSAEQQFKIIKELCEHELLIDNIKAKDLKIKLITRYGDLSTDSDSVNEILIDETKHWLHGYDESLKLYEDALHKFKNSIFERNLLDDLRLSLEKLVREILNNSKSLENQLSDLGSFIQGNGGSKELGNMFQKLVEYFTKYQNTYIKHDDKVIEEEVEFMFEITSSFMKHFIRMKK